MNRPGGSGPARRVAGVFVAVLAALVLAVAPPAARPAFAAIDPLRTEASATYTLDPDAGRVHVAIHVTETDLKPDTAQFVYSYHSFGFALQPEATAVRVSGGSAYRITTHERDGYTEALVSISKALHYRQSTSFTIRYELLGGKPRSATPTRVGAAYSTFGVWAWGDPGYSTVEVRTPAGFDTRFNGDTMQVTSSATTGQILRAKPADPSEFFTIITAEDSEAYAETRISLAGGVEIVVQSWPEDGPWKTSVTGTLRKAMPELRRLIGLDWPVAHDLDVRERYTPDLEGYAGFFVTDEQRIEVSEDLDPLVIVHEASHAWFSDALFLERWIYEGLAEEYASQVLADVGDDDGTAEEPDPRDPGFVDLEVWTHPGVIKDQETDDRERFGYEAAFWVIHVIVEAAGVDQMRDAFAAADASVTAYPGAVTPETVHAGDTWRRLLDLTQPLDKPEPAAVNEALRSFVLRPADEASLDKRIAARDDYRALLRQGGAWVPGWYVRESMGAWDFDAATRRMAEAADVLELRDRVATMAAALGLAPDNALRVAYEVAKAGFGDATAIGQAQLRALAAIADAKSRVERAPDLFAQVGLLGETPAISYDAARAAFVAGNTSDALTLANAVTSLIDGAPAVGQQRLVIAGVTTLGALLLLTLLIALVRRRRRRSRALALAAAVLEDVDLPAAPDMGSAPVQPYATLAADPASDHDEGGQAPG
ncbi:MAG: hypothetical protein ABI620_00240 [Chloroflexota bacterium]